MEQAARMGCLDEAALDDFVAGRLRGGGLAAAEAHLDSCVACREVAVVLAGGELGASRGAASGGPAWGAELPRGAELGRHVVLATLGEGAMGRVYLGYDPTLDRRVALKVLRPAGGPSAPDRSRARASRDERVLREAQALARLAHPNVVAVYEAGRSEAGVYLAMEYVAGATLRAWLAAEARGPRRVCEAFLQAGAGLAAAHAAGLVHRDVKPDNVLVGDDGRVRVTDFGLATFDAPAGAGVAGADDAGAGDAASREADRPRGLAGTPAYMAPEQLAGERATPASDQFAFCVALYEALCGVRPFAGRGLAELRAAVERGVPTRGAGAPPARVAAVLRRGLAARPEGRYPSMAALLDELRAAAAPRRRALAASVALALGAAALAFAARPSPPADPCAGGDERAAAAWGDARRGELERALRAAGAPAAGAAAARVSAGLDAYARGWRGAYRATCEATAVRHEQSPDVLDARMHCLRQRFDAFDALVDALAVGDLATLAAAGDAVAGLPPVADCADAVTLVAMDRRPSEPAAAARLLALERRLADLRAAGLAGHYERARALAAELVPEAVALGHRPTAAGARLLAAANARRAGAYAEAEAEAREALFAAEAGRDDRGAARAWLELVAVAGERGDVAGALASAQHARAAVARVGDAPLLSATLHHQRGVALTAAGALDEAGAELERSLALATKELGEAHVEVARTWSALGNLARARGELERALALHERALAIDERALGEGHPAAARHHHNLGGVLRLLGRRGEALASYRRALELETSGLGARHPATALTRNSLALALLEGGEAAAARAELAQALDVLGERLHPDRGLVLHNLGLAAQFEGDHRAALAHFDAAAAAFEQAPGPGRERMAALRASREESLRALGRERRARAGAGGATKGGGAARPPRRADLAPPAPPPPAAPAAPSTAPAPSTLAPVAAAPSTAPAPAPSIAPAAPPALAAAPPATLRAPARPTAPAPSPARPPPAARRTPPPPPAGAYGPAQPWDTRP